MNTLLAYGYLLRAPLVCWLLVTLLAPLSVSEEAPLREAAGGLFDLDWWGVFWAALAGALAASTFLVTGLLVVEYGSIRCGLPARSKWLGHRLGRWLGFPVTRGAVATAVFSLAAPASLAWGIGRTSEEVLWPMALAVLLFLVIFGVAALSWHRSIGPVMKLFAGLIRFTPAGYLEHEDGVWRVRPGHGFAMTWGSVFLAAYLLVGLSKLARLSGWVSSAVDRWAPDPPTLAYAVILVSVWCWFFGALAFFFDRFRVPVIVPFLLLVAAASTWQQADHYFPVTAVEDLQPLTPAQVLLATPGAATTPIVVCASGGGIQAEAWTAKVLIELERIYRGRLAASIRLISAASGGSAGAGHFAAAYQGGGIADSELEAIFGRATASSLDAVAWGMLYPDLARLFVPQLVPRWIGRGWSMERAWDPEGRLRRSLSGWRAGVRAGNHPALLFNTTLTETGERLALPTFDFPRKAPSLWNTVPPRSLREVYGSEFDVSIITAARLSAAFPYVSAASRPDTDLPQSKRYHVVDGGYYDNFGVSSAVNFLDQACADERLKRVGRVLLVEIRSNKSQEGRAAHKGQGWFFQVAAPLRTLINVRTTAQRARNDDDVAMLRDALARNGITLHHAVFESPQESVPLSWHLTKAQIRRIHEAWRDQFEKQKEGIEEVRKVGAYLDLAAR